MQVDQFVTGVNSEDPERLISFYRDVVGLQAGPVPGSFMAGSASFFAIVVGDHSELSGPTKEPQRAMLNFFITDIAGKEASLKEQGVEFIKSATRVPGVTIATFKDPDGNYCQLLEIG